MNYRRGHIGDLEKLKQLALVAWRQFQNDLTKENWKKLLNTLSDDDTYLNLLQSSQCIICQTKELDIIGMTFLVGKGNPTEIYEEHWSYIRFVSVNPNFGGQGIGKELTKRCIELAKKNKEQVIALHTSEMMEKAIHIYKSFGFEILREIEPRLGKKYWLYKLDLEEDKSSEEL